MNLAAYHRRRRRRSTIVALAVVALPAAVLVTVVFSRPGFQVEPPISRSPNSRWVSRDTFEGDWPFTVDAGELRCEGSLIVFRVGGADYGVNGLARMHGYASKQPIWKELDGGGWYVSVSDMIQAGLALCDDARRPGP